MSIERDYYKILIVGSSGKGKTYMFRNLDPATTGFINVENKPLPFKNNLKYHVRPTTYQEVLKAIAEFHRNADIQTIVIDSFSAYGDLVLQEARSTKRGFDIWSMYNEEVARFNTLVKKVSKETFVTAHYEILNLEGDSEKRVKVFAKQWEGQVERDYTIVLYAENKFNDENKPEYYLSLVGQNTSAKCPPDIFGEDVVKIPNDAKYIIEKVNEFVS